MSSHWPTSEPWFEAHVAPEARFWLAQFSGDTRYTFAVARVRSWEKDLLRSGHYLRLLETPDWPSLLHTLQAQPGYQGLAGSEEASAVFSFLLRRFEEQNQQLEALLLDPWLKETLQGFAQFDRLKKTQTPEQLQDWLARIPGTGRLGGALRKTVQQIQLWQRSGRLANEIEFFIETHQFRFLLQGFLQSGLKFFVHLARWWADVLAVQVLLRWQWWGSGGEPWAFLPESGFLGARHLRQLAENPHQVLENYLQHTPYRELLRNGIAALRKHVPLWAAEQAAHQLLSRIFSLTRYTSFGPEPLVAYWWYIRQEYFNLQLILRARLAGLSTGIVKTHIHLPYEETRLSA